MMKILSLTNVTMLSEQKLCETLTLKPSLLELLEILMYFNWVHCLNVT